MGHTLTLTDRRADGIPHYHRWLPSCVCGWSAPPKRHRKEASDEYRDHLRSVTRVKARTRTHPRALTPTDMLPEEFR